MAFMYPSESTYDYLVTVIVLPWSLIFLSHVTFFILTNEKVPILHVILSTPGHMVCANNSLTVRISK